MKKLIIPPYFEQSPPDIFKLCFLLMKYYKANPYPCIENVNRRTKNIIQVQHINQIIFSSREKEIICILIYIPVQQKIIFYFFYFNES